MEYMTALETIEKLLTEPRPHERLQKIVDFLYDTFEKYSWVGIYLVKENDLILGPWQGKNATEHTTIQIGKGVCGSAAKTGKTEVVDDVSLDKRYLACFVSTRSEIVVPIKKKERVIGEIDIDSDTIAAFNKEDKQFLEKVADMLAKHIS